MGRVFPEGVVGGCLLCGSSDQERETGRYSRCACCGTLSQTSPPDRPALDESEARYAHGILAAEHRWLALVEAAGTVERSLLDLGAGDGGFVGLAAERGWRARGIEGSPAMVARGREREWPVEVGNVDEWVSGASFGAVRVWFVLEHIRFPGRLLAEACRSVRPGGLLLVAVPNDAGWLSRRLMQSDQDRFWEHPLHLHHFPPFGLERVLAGRGFELLVGEAGRPSELMRGGALPLHETWERARELDPGLCRLFYQLGVGRTRELMFRKPAGA